MPLLDGADGLGRDFNILNLSVLTSRWNRCTTPRKSLSSTARSQMVLRRRRSRGRGARKGALAVVAVLERDWDEVV
jgi:hypothetical protein